MQKRYRLTLVVISIDDILVVVNRTGLAFVIPRQLGRLEVADIENVGDGQFAGCWALYSITLIQFIVEDEELLV